MKDLLIIPLGDPQVILGTAWLKELGLARWDFNLKTLKFRRMGKAITLKGVNPGKIDVGREVVGKVVSTQGSSLCSPIQK